nr:atherin-like [Bubalus bubalis]
MATTAGRIKAHVAQALLPENSFQDGIADATCRASLSRLWGEVAAAPPRVAHAGRGRAGGDGSPSRPLLRAAGPRLAPPAPAHAPARWYAARRVGAPAPPLRDARQAGPIRARGAAPHAPGPPPFQLKKGRAGPAGSERRAGLSAWLPRRRAASVGSRAHVALERRGRPQPTAQAPPAARPDGAGSPACPRTLE